MVAHTVALVEMVLCMAEEAVALVALVAVGTAELTAVAVVAVLLGLVANMAVPEEMLRTKKAKTEHHLLTPYFNFCRLLLKTFLEKAGRYKPAMLVAAAMAEMAHMLQTANLPVEVAAAMAEMAVLAEQAIIILAEEAGGLEKMEGPQLVMAAAVAAVSLGTELVATAEKIQVRLEFRWVQTVAAV